MGRSVAASSPIENKNGRLSPIIDSITPLAEAKTALQRLQDGDVRGKLVLAV